MTSRWVTCSPPSNGVVYFETTPGLETQMPSLGLQRTFGVITRPRAIQSDIDVTNSLLPIRVNAALGLRLPIIDDGGWRSNAHSHRQAIGLLYMHQITARCAAGGGPWSWVLRPLITIAQLSSIFRQCMPSGWLFVRWLRPEVVDELGQAPSTRDSCRVRMLHSSPAASLQVVDSNSALRSTATIRSTWSLSPCYISPMKATCMPE